MKERTKPLAAATVASRTALLEVLSERRFNAQGVTIRTGDKSQDIIALRSFHTCFVRTSNELLCHMCCSEEAIIRTVANGAEEVRRGD